LTSLSATCGLIIYIFTPTTPTIVLAPALFIQGLTLAPTIVAASNVATGNVPIADVNDVSTMYFFVRQLGNTAGVTAATVLFDHRMTFHSSRLLDTANQLDPTTRMTLSAYANLVRRNAGAAYRPLDGALQIFLNNVIAQSRLLSYLDIYFGLAFISIVGALLLWYSRSRLRSANAVTYDHPHRANHTW